MLNYIVVILLTVVTLSMLNFNMVTRSLEEVTNNHTRQMVQQVQTNIEFYIMNMEKNIHIISEDTSLLKYINQDYESDENKQVLEQEILHMLGVYSQVELAISGMLFADAYGNYLSHNMEKIESTPLTMEFWYRQAVTNPDEVLLFSKPIRRNVRSVYDYYSADNVISIAKAVKDAQGTVKGVLMVDMKLTVIKDIIDSAVLGKSGFLYVADVHGDVVYAPINPIVYRIHPDLIRLNHQSSIHMIGNHSYQILKEFSKYTQWHVIGIFPTNETLSIIIEVIMYIILYGILILLFAILFSGFLTRSLTKPISKLRQLMARAEHGELEVRFDSKYQDEIGKLGNSFNHMIESMKNLINLVYVEQQKKREAELKAFQAQIKPHFLYNTLDTINWMASDYEADDISDMITSLTTLFRISLSKGKEMIPLKEEIKHVESYLTIQMARYEGKFDYILSDDRELRDCKVIKLILQPIVENAIYHGIKESEVKGNIWINVEQQGHTLCLSVKDNGRGIDHETIKEMNLIFNGEKSKPSHYGIGMFNVNERLKLSFGHGYGIQIESVEGEGTTVYIRHPIIRD